MNIFDIIPSNYFAIFQGKNRKIYAESLLILFEMLQNDEAILNKEDYLRALKDKGSAFIENFDYSEETLDEFSEDEEIDLNQTISSKASFIIRRLQETGWIDVSIDPETFEENIILANYSVIFLRALNEVLSDETAPYMAYVHSTYSELKLEDEERDELMYATVLRSYDATKKLRVELIGLIHSIRIFQTKLGKLFETNSILHSTFDIYKEKIINRYYHPLKTFDSVAKFKRPIIKILEGWLKDNEIRNKLVNQAALLSSTNNKNEIEKDIVTKINYITDTYETINNLIANIDKENSKYTKSSANKILYLNNSDRSIKGHLENILKHYSKNVDNSRNLSKILSDMQESIFFYEQGYIDSECISLPLLRKMKLNGEPLELADFDSASELVMSKFLEETKNIYTDERVYHFIDTAFGGDKELNIKDIDLPNDDAFICLILATVKKDYDTCFYDIEIIDDTKIQIGDYIVPNLVFHRKEM